MKESSSYILFQLMLSALGNEVNVSELPADIDWREVIDHAFCQGVAAIAVDGLSKVYGVECMVEGFDALDSPELEALKYEWFGSTFQAEENYQRYKTVIESLAKILSAHNQRLLLLKGYALSQVYPIPKHRPLGDIDLFQGLAGDEAFRDAGIDVKAEYHKHSTFLIESITVENHLKFLDDIKHRSNRKFERILQQLNDSKDYPKEELPIGGQTILLPNATFNALFLLRHAGEHFAAHEICLRQILDFGLFINENHSKIDWPYVLKVFREEKMMPFYDAIGTICVEHLGMDLPAFEGLTINMPLAEKVLADIFLPQKEGDVPNRKKHIVKYGLFMTRRWWRNRWKYKMVYNESLLDSFWTLAVNRVRGEKGGFAN